MIREAEVNEIDVHSDKIMVILLKLLDLTLLAVARNAQTSHEFILIRTKTIINY